MADIFKAIKRADIEQAQEALREHGTDVLLTKNADGLTPLAYLRERVQSAHNMVSDARATTNIGPDVIEKLVARAEKFDQLKNYFDVVCHGIAAQSNLTAFQSASTSMAVLETQHQREIQEAASKTMHSAGSMLQSMR